MNYQLNQSNESNDIDLASGKRSTDGIRQLITKAYEYNNTLIVAGDFNYKNMEWENEFVRNGYKHLMEFIETILSSSARVRTDQT